MSIFLATALSFIPEESQAQLMLTIRPSASDANNPILVFSGSTTASGSESIRTTASGPKENQDTFEIPSLYSLNSQVFSALSPLSTLAADDPDRLAEGDSAPTITIADTNAISISHIAFDGRSGLGDPDIGIRASTYHFYSTLNTVSWSGAGILTNFNMSQFSAGTYQSSSHPKFSNHPLRLTVRNSAIPEPEEYALLFAIFALGFVFFHHRMMQKKQRRQQAAATTTGNTA